MRKTRLVTKAILSHCAIAILAIPCIATDDTIEMRRYRCGYNSVYMLLRLSGIDCDYHALKINRNSGKEGLSIKDLSEELSRCGLPASVLQCGNAEGVRKLSPPFIIYTNPDRSETVGHFLVVTSVDAETINLIDGSTSESKQYAISKLGNLWDGYAIVPERNHAKHWRWFVGIPLTIGGLVLVTRSIWHGQRMGSENA